MKNKTIALLAVPVLIAVSTLTVAKSDSKENCENKYDKGDMLSKHAARNPERMLKKLTKKLDLNEQQQTELKSLFEQQQSVREAGKEARTALHEAIRSLDVNAADYSEQLAKVKSQAGLSAQGKIDKIMAMKQGMSEILTPEQLTQFEELAMKKEKGKYRNH